MGIENPVHLLFIAIIALVVLGPKRLPELARALGNGIREFRESVSGQGEPTIEQTLAARQPAAQPDPGAPDVVDPVATSAAASGAPASDATLHGDHDVPAAAAGPAVPTVDPGQPVRSDDAPDSRPL